MGSMKLSFELSTHVDELLAEQFRRRAADAGCTVSDLLRDLITLQIYGVTYGEHVAQIRRSALSGPAPDQAQVRPGNQPSLAQA
jgi:hypothetical protein